MRRRRWIRAAAAALAAAAVTVAIAPRSASASAQTPAEAEAQRTVRDVADRVLAILRTPGLASAERRKRIEAIAWDWFDVDTMARLVVARDWRSFTPAQRTAFIDAFRQLLSVRYGRKLDAYDQEQVEIVSSRVEPNGDVTVRTRIERPNGESEVTVDYRLRRHDDRYLAVDAVIEGVSLVFSYRGQFQSILASKGPDGLIERVREKNASLADDD